MDNCFSVSSIGSKGGLALLWSNDVDINVGSYFSNRIYVDIENYNSMPWRFMGFYGEPSIEDCWRSWKLIRHLAYLGFGGIMFCRDFNEMLSLRVLPRPMSQILRFREVVTNLDL